MLSKKLTAVAVAVAASSAVGITAAVGAESDAPPTRDQATQEVTARFAAFDRPRNLSDTFTSNADVPSPAVAEIAKTSRRVVATQAGDAFTFLNEKNEVCFLWRPAGAGVAATNCTDAENGTAPSIMIGLGGTLNTPTLAGLVPKGTDRVTVSRPDGSTTDVPINDGAYVYSGASPFQLTWTGPDGKVFVNDVKPMDFRNLKPVG